MTVNKYLLIALAIIVPVIAVAALYSSRFNSSSNPWASYVNTLYRYSIQYPQSPVAFLSPRCGGVLTESEPPEVCSEIGIQAGVIALQEVLEIHIIDKPAYHSFEDFVENVAKSAHKKEFVEIKRFGDRKTYGVTFQGGLGYSGNEDGKLFGQKTFALFIALNDNKVLRLTYPLEFCDQVVNKGNEGLFLIESTCYTDERNKLYEEISKTLMLN